MGIDIKLPSPLEKILIDQARAYSIDLKIKRDDLIHPEVSGNKWRKLKYYLERARYKKLDQLMSFGGAYSNHIAAIAALGQEENIKTIGIIRGDELNINSNLTLQKAHDNGMELIFVDRETYKLRNNVEYLNSLYLKRPNSLIIPEGGRGFDGMMGVAEIAHEIDSEPDFWVVPVGTGTTLAGLLWQSDASVIAAPIFKNYQEQEANVRDLLMKAGMCNDEVQKALERVNWHPIEEFGVFGKINQKADNLLIEWSQELGFEFDTIYNGKTWLKMIQLIENGFFKAGSSIVMLHTGGLQSRP